MARYVRDARNPANPDIFGEDAWDLLYKAAGLGVTEFGAQKITTPLVKQLIPGSAANPTLGKFADAAATALTAWTLGELVGLADDRIGRQMKVGGLVLAAGKGLSIVVPGFSISASIPAPANFPMLGAAPPALPAANGNGKADADMARLGVRSMGL